MKQNNKGFTMIELLVSIVILAVVLLGLASSIILVKNVNLKNTIRNFAQKIINNEIEEQRAFGFENLADKCSASACNPEDNNSNCVVEVPLRNTTIKFGRIVKILNSANPDIKQMDIEVCWKIKNKLYSDNMTTLIRRENY